MENILISKCLLGEVCRYDGKVKKYEDIEKLFGKYNFIPVCPECDGGLSTPRPPAEICGGKVINSVGEDVTENYVRGACMALLKARNNGCKRAILKAKSPSCGSSEVYDGTFSKTLIKGEGICAKLLRENGIEIFSENETEKFTEGK